MDRSTATRGALAVAILTLVVALGWVLHDVLGSFAFLGAIQLALVYAFVGLGVYLSFRVLDFPDLTVDGTFPLGGAVAAVIILGDGNPWLATLAAIAAGSIAGLITAFLNVRFKILHLLASILTMIALYSINLRIMGQSNLSVRGHDTIITPFYDHGLADNIVRPLFLLAMVVVVVIALAWFLSSNFGLGMRAVGTNPKMAMAQGIRTDANKYVGMAISNALVGLAGALYVQTALFTDVGLGIGTIVVGLAAVIVGESLFRLRWIWVALVGCVLGSIVYRLALQFALDWDGFCVGSSFCVSLTASDLNLITALLVAAALILPRIRARRIWGGR